MTTTQGAAAASAAADSRSASPAAPTISHPYTSLSHSIKTLDGSMATGKSNYVARKFRVLHILKEKGLVSALEDVATDDSDSAVSSTTTERMNDQVFTIISLNIRDCQIPHIQCTSNAKEA